MNNHFIYKLIDVKAARVFYIGQSTTERNQTRFYYHKVEAYNKNQKAYNRAKSIYIRSITTYANFEQDIKEEIIKDQLTKEEVLLEEYRAICNHNNLTNTNSGLSYRTINSWYWSQLSKTEKQHFFVRDSNYSDFTTTLANLSDSPKHQAEATELYIAAILANGFYYSGRCITQNINLLIENNKLPKELTLFVSANNQSSNNAKTPDKYKIFINKVSSSKLTRIGALAIDIDNNEEKQIEQMSNIGLLNYLQTINNKLQWKPQSRGNKIRSGIYELEFLLA